ncbi:ribosome hibernation-promoting factor, HPF/YfiA family [Zhaonella formicivorans]|jgi:putative sigma-54 modulation protein|uniref:ribosome hibernation-promoting factor, HPF/YfiA family n=1 Tax=Zhaonella formicivorans TaxID=2528593 RepID=UPI001D103991|nr:ribosome-associated translation inhibitor RaiA [Zhaonella formicivorans]
MKITVRGKNIQMTNALRQHVEKRLGRLDKYFEADTEAQVTLTVERDRHVVEVTIPLNGYILRGEEETGDMYASIDLVLDKLEKQIEKYKTKLAKKLRSQSLKELAGNDSANGYEEPKILKTKHFSIKPMPVEEAIMQMNLLGHSFFVFSNAETEQVNVVYRRKDGNYGLIEPEY